jgi:hypothetical protein
VSEERPRDRFIEKVGCFLIAIPVGAFIVTATAQELNIPPAGIFLGAAVVALVAGGFGSGSRPATSPNVAPPTTRPHAAPQRRSTYSQMREIVERFESGEISTERRDQLVRELRR